MLGKLMKYEMKAMGRIFLPLYGAIIVLSGINRLLIAIKFAVPIAIGSTVWGFLFSGICVMTLVFTIQRFRRNLLGLEGYLMFTLPVSTDELILSKLFTASIWGILSSIALIISVWIMAGARGLHIRQTFMNIAQFIRDSHLGALNATFFTIEALLIGILMLFCTVMLFYTCVSLSLLVSKRRGLFSFGAFVVITIIGQILGVLGIRIGSSLHLERLDVATAEQFFGFAHKAFGFGILIELVTVAIFYFVTRYMLTHKLNLE